MTAVVAGVWHTCALTGAGGVTCWGRNASGQVSGPADVPGLNRGVTAIAAGDQHTCAVREDGGVRCWGANYVGELGAPGPDMSDVPIDVAGIGGEVIGVAAGDGHTCALTAAGAVKCWGLGVYGELGDGRNTDSVTPVDVTGLGSGVTAISAGGRRTCALTGGGGVKCWGEPWYDAFFVAAGGSNVPLDVPGLAAGVIAIASAAQHQCALMVTATVKCWGSSSHGQLGSLSTRDSSEPVDAVGLGDGVVAIAASIGHTCGTKGDGVVTCLGDNWYGQLGTQTRCTSTTRPVAVAIEPGVVVPLPTSEPTRPPDAPIDHAVGSTDVILRYEHHPDLGVSDLGGEEFQPGAEFTLYGDGTVIFRNEMLEPPPAEGAIVRARPFKTAHLTEDGVQSLLRFALGDGGLESACDRYEFRGDVDGYLFSVHSVRAGGIDKTVVSAGELGPLTEHLRNFDIASGIAAEVYRSDRFVGNLLGAAPYINDGLLPPLPAGGAVRWPWPNIAPSDFEGLTLDDGRRPGRRDLSAAEAAVLGLSNNGGLVKRIYLLGPDAKTIFSFSMWPVLPD